jgi:hypothetical protein
MGKRLPQEVIDRSPRRRDPEKYFTSRCFVSESLESGYYDVNGPFIWGRSSPPCTDMTSACTTPQDGAGAEAARRWTGMCLEMGPLTVTATWTARGARGRAELRAGGGRARYPQGTRPGRPVLLGCRGVLFLAELYMTERGARDNAFCSAQTSALT